MEKPQIIPTKKDYYIITAFGMNLGERELGEIRNVIEVWDNGIGSETLSNN
jgi:hypothetical protein